MRRRLSYDGLVQGRIRRTLSLLAIVYLVLGARFFYIQVIRASHFKEIAEEFRLRPIPLRARRGIIYDRDGKKLAVNVEAYDVAVRPVKITDKGGTAEQIAPIIGWDNKDLLARLHSPKKFIYLERGVDADIGKRVRNLKLPGVEAIRTVGRVYPAGSLAAHVIGFTNIDGDGIEGLEKAYDRYLRGRDGYVIAEIDARGRVIPGTRRHRVEPVHGMDLVLTIDATIQHALETELARSFADYGAVGASAVVMDPQTGEILALANMPDYDPNRVGDYPPDARRNRAVTDLYEPGSTLKTITACAALEEKVVDLDDTFYCSGSMRVGRRRVRCSLHRPFMAGHRACNVAKILRYSCNMGAAGLGLRLGKQKLWEYEKAFGLYEKPGSGMLGETCARSAAADWENWEDVRLVNIAFGQGIVVTPLQLASAYAAVANGGVLMRPHILREIRRPDGAPEKIFGPRVVRRVISERTAGLVSQMLHGVVTGGTGKTGRVDGYRTAGKTGSAQKVVDGRYAPDKFIASFVGFLPITDPRVIILVAVDEPQGIHWGARVAAPVFKEVGRKAMWHMKVPPDDVDDSAPIADGIPGSGSERAERNRPRSGLGG